MSSSSTSRRFWQRSNGVEEHLGNRLRARLWLEALEDRTSPSVTPLGAAFQVNTFTEGSQDSPVAAANVVGNTVVAWQSLGGDSSFYGVYAQRHDALGNPLGDELKVNTFITGNQWQPDVAMDLAGNFVITWQSDDQDGSHQGIYARRFGASGKPLGDEFQVNTFTPGDQIAPAVAVDFAGNFVITWQSDGQDGSHQGIYARRYDASGKPLGDEFQVSTLTPAVHPTLAVDPNGNFLVAWEVERAGGIWARSFDGSAIPFGQEFLVANSSVTSRLDSVASDPSVAVDPAGNFVITWERSDFGVLDKSHSDLIEARRYDVEGNPVGSELLVNTNPGNSASNPSVATDASGNLLFAWVGQEGSIRSLFARRFDAAGNPVSGEVQVNPAAETTQQAPSVTSAGNDRFVITWESPFQDGSDFGIFARRYLPLQGSSTIGTLDPSTGTWYLRNSNSPGESDIPTFAYGEPGWRPVVGDWDGNGTTTVGTVDASRVNNPSLLVWYLRNSNTPGAEADHQFTFGSYNWEPVAGDWTGNGVSMAGVVDTTGMQNPSAMWYFRTDHERKGILLNSYAFGLPGWVPLTGDWDGDGIDTPGMFDPSTATWYLRASNDPADPNVISFVYGGPGWTPVAGDWDGDGITTIGVVDVSGNWHLRNDNSAGAAITVFPYGVPGWIPVVGAWALNDAGDTLVTARGVNFITNQRQTLTETLGNNHGNNDVDLYRVNLRGGDILTADIDARESNLAGNLDSILRIFDANGSQLASNDDAIDPDTGVRGLDSFLEFTASSTGTYYIGVSSYADFNYNPNEANSGLGRSNGDYRLLVTLSRAIDDAGDTLQTAQPLALAVGRPTTVSEILGNNFGNNDVDFYRVSLQRGDSLAADIDARESNLPGTLDSILRAFDANGRELRSNDNGRDPDTGLFGPDSFLQFTASSTGTYYIGVSSYANFDYNPNVANSGQKGISTGDYRLILDLRAAR